MPTIKKSRRNGADDMNFITLQLFRICWLFENDPDYPDSLKTRYDTS